MTNRDHLSCSEIILLRNLLLQKVLNWHWNSLDILSLVKFKALYQEIFDLLRFIRTKCHWGSIRMLIKMSTSVQIVNCWHRYCQCEQYIVMESETSTKSFILVDSWMWFDFLWPIIFIEAINIFGLGFR